VSSFIRNSIIKQNEGNPLGVIKFFDPGVLGIELGKVEGGVRVEAVRDGKPFAQAGIRKDDIVVAIDGVKVDSPETCRRLLRRRVVEDKTTTLQVQRGEKRLEVAVKFMD